MHNGEDFYLTNKIPVNRLEYLRCFDLNNHFLPFSKLQEIEKFDAIKYVWNPLTEYRIEENQKRWER